MDPKTPDGVLKHYRVLDCRLSIDGYTVTAASPDEAIKKVNAGKGQREAETTYEPKGFMNLAFDRADLGATIPDLEDLIKETTRAWQLLQHAQLNAMRLAQDRMESAVDAMADQKN